MCRKFSRDPRVGLSVGVSRPFSQPLRFAFSPVVTLNLFQHDGRREAGSKMVSAEDAPPPSRGTRLFPKSTRRARSSSLSFVYVTRRREGAKRDGEKSSHKGTKMVCANAPIYSARSALEGRLRRQTGCAAMSGLFVSLCETLFLRAFAPLREVDISSLRSLRPLREINGDCPGLSDVARHAAIARRAIRPHRRAASAGGQAEARRRWRRSVRDCRCGTRR